MTTQQSPFADDGSDTPVREETSEIDIDDELQSFRLRPRETQRQDQTPEKIYGGGGQISSLSKKDQDEAMPNH